MIKAVPIDTDIIWLRHMTRLLVSLMVMLGLVACNGSPGVGTTMGAPVEEPAPQAPSALAPPAARTLVGTLAVDNGALTATVARQVTVAQVPPGTTAWLDGQTSGVAVDSDGRFQTQNLADGDHSLFIHLGTGEEVAVPFRMRGRRGLNLGTVTIRNGRLAGMTGFDGYRFGFVDEDGDGINDLCTDTNGNGFCDAGRLYAGYTYLMDMGYLDADGDGVNDAFIDADGDGVNDRTGHGYTMGFGHQGGMEMDHGHAPLEWPMEPPMGPHPPMGGGHLGGPMGRGGM
jgi:hypothetical protein